MLVLTLLFQGAECGLTRECLMEHQAAAEDEGLEQPSNCRVLPEGFWSLQGFLRSNRGSSGLRVVRFDLCEQNMRHKPELDRAH